MFKEALKCDQLPPFDIICYLYVASVNEALNVVNCPQVYLNVRFFFINLHLTLVMEA